MVKTDKEILKENFWPSKFRLKYGKIVFVLIFIVLAILLLSELFAVALPLLAIVLVWGIIDTFLRIKKYLKLGQIGIAEGPRRPVDAAPDRLIKKEREPKTFWFIIILTLGFLAGLSVGLFFLMRYMFF